jgi:hypothetical protein
VAPRVRTGLRSTTMTTWRDLDAATRYPPSTLEARVVPELPGVYAWYRGGDRMYVGKADSLRDRVWGNHLGQGRALSSSAFRRNVAAHLGFGSAAAIKAGDMVLTETQLNEVRQWIMGCEVAWLTCATAADAAALETSLKQEFKPPLTKR